MGINGFFPWYKRNFSSTITKLNYDTTIQGIDNFAIDLNGIFHPIAQRVFRYGNYKDSNIQNYKSSELDVYREICNKIDELVFDVSPSKRLILCIDGIAPFAKQQQQRKRRFKSSLEKSDISNFDPNCISVGTKFMHELSKYIKEHVEKSLKDNEKWKNLTVIFSSEKVKGEGEHKGINYFRNLPNEETYCIHALDADLIMLCLGMIEKNNVYVIRDENYGRDKYNLLNIGEFRKLLMNRLNPNEYVSSKLCIYDFIVIISLIGNDFLPTIPCIDVWNNGIEKIIEIYEYTCEKTNRNIVNEDIKIDLDVLKVFFQYFSLFEKEMIDDFVNSPREYFRYEILEKSLDINENIKSVDIEKFRKLYNLRNFNNFSINDVCREYIKGLEWILSYYITGKLIWEWYYPYHYSPFSYYLYKLLETKDYESMIIKESKNIIEGQYFQLMCVLPINSFYLIPDVLTKDIIINMKEKYPEKFIVDIEGKSREYEGICLIPIIDINSMKEIYYKNIEKINEEERELNKIEVDIIYNSE